MNILTSVVATTDLVILVYFLVLNSFYALLLVLSIPEIWEQTRLAEDEDFQRLMQSDALPPITILVPAYNESATIQASVTALLTLEYRSFEVIVVNDGSKDDTMERLHQAFDLYDVPRIYPETIPTKPLRGLYRSRSRSRLLVLDKENGGKADSLNAAINASRFPLVIAVDADTLIEPDALLRLTRPFLLGRQIAAVGGTVRVANNCTVKDGRVTDARVPRRIIPGIQVVEYLRAFLFGRLGWNRLGGNLVISGAFGLFRKDYVMAVHGYDTSSIVEDLDLVVRMHRYLRQHKIKYEMPFIPDPVAWTEVPESFKILSRQRERWHRGLISAMWQFKTMLFNPRHGRIGLLAMPFFTLGEMLAPVVELLGYLVTALGLATGLLNVSFALLFVLVAWGYGMLLSVWAVVLEEVSFRRYRRFGDLFLLLLYAALENFGYRQLSVFWRLKAFANAWRGVRKWGEMARKGFGKPSVAALLALCLATPSVAQSRVNVWGGYENVEDSDDWTTLGGQLTVRTAKGSGGWFAVEMLGRYADTDVTERFGGVLHPNDGWWFTLEMGTSRTPLFSPKNSWEADAATLVGRRSSVGLTYRRGNYSDGAVDMLIPRFSTETPRMSSTLRLFISRNPSDRTDWAGQFQIAWVFSPRITGSLLGAGGRETYSVAGSLQSLETTTIGLGARYNAGNNMTVRLDATFINSQPTLSRRGISLGLERGL